MGTLVPAKTGVPTITFGDELIILLFITSASFSEDDYPSNYYSKIEHKIRFVLLIF